MRATPDGPALVGRDRELAALTAACRSGAGGLTLVEGEAGSGKTRLDEVATAVARAGVPVHRGHAVPAAGAFRPLAEALAGAAAPALADRARIAPFRAVLARILPSWPAGPAAGAHLVDPVVVLGEALVELLEALEAAGRARRRADPSGSREALRRAERLAAEHGLTAWRTRALSELGVNDLFGTGDGSSMRQAEDLARDAGMLGTATMLELQQTAFATGVEGPVAATDRAQRCAEHAAGSV